MIGCYNFQLETRPVLSSLSVCDDSHKVLLFNCGLSPVFCAVSSSYELFSKMLKSGNKERMEKREK